MINNILLYLIPSLNEDFSPKFAMLFSKCRFPYSSEVQRFKWIWSSQKLEIVFVPSITMLIRTDIIMKTISTKVNCDFLHKNWKKCWFSARVPTSTNLYANEMTLNFITGAFNKIRVHFRKDTSNLFRVFIIKSSLKMN